MEMSNIQTELKFIRYELRVAKYSRYPKDKLWKHTSAINNILTSSMLPLHCKLLRKTIPKWKYPIVNFALCKKNSMNNVNLLSNKTS